ncbi:MAG: Lrp/AsnC family transcriptional regulator [Desulfitobacteriaceae bacterium]
MGEQDNSSGLDKIDMVIIQQLSDDGRKPFTEIAETLGVSERTVRSRVEKMRASGVLNIVAVVNSILIGLKVQAIIQIAVESESLATVIEVFQKMNPVRFIVATSGEYQLLIQVRVSTPEKLANFVLEELIATKGIQRFNVIIELKQFKNTFKIFLEDE